jgi:hypothetical protein
MGTNFLEVACDEHGIGGSDEYSGDSRKYVAARNNSPLYT